MTTPGEIIEYRGFKMTVQPIILQIEPCRVVAKKGKKSFAGLIGEVVKEINAWLDRKEKIK